MFYNTYHMVMRMRDFNGKPYYEGIEVITTCVFLGVHMIFIICALDDICQHFFGIGQDILEDFVGREASIKIFFVLLADVIPYAFFKWHKRYQVILDECEEYEMPLHPLGTFLVSNVASMLFYKSVDWLLNS